MEGRSERGMDQEGGEIEGGMLLNLQVNSDLILWISQLLCDRP